MARKIASRSLWECERFHIDRVTYRLDNGTEHEREVIRHPGSVVILPKFADGRVCLIRNYRASIDETLVELPAGTCEPGEDPTSTAHRELKEETGFLAGRMHFVAEFYAAPGILDESMRLYVAEQLSEAAPSRESYEQIENLILPQSEAKAMIAEGQIRDAKTMIGLTWP